MVPPDDVGRRYAATLPPGDVLALDTLFALRAGTQGIDNMLSQWLGKDALSPGRWQVLVVLWSSDKAIPQREIVNALKVSRPTVSALVETLVGDGYASVVAASEDRRQVLVSLTPAGRHLTDRLVRDNARRLREMFSNMSDDQLRQLTTLLAMLVS